jgi:NAD(P)-dependent dehydrogenase (short-subunit alcohol dehydrogenase family)
VLNFFASWCDPCNREAGVLSAAARRARTRVVFLGADVNDYRPAARRFLRVHRVPFAAVRPGSRMVKAFGLIGLPETFYLDRRGHVVVVASVYAFMNGLMASPYAAAKAGVEQIGRALRAELSVHGASASVAYFGFIDTDMVRDAFAQPGAQKAEEMFPAFVTRRLKPSVAGTAIVDGIQARAQMIIRPRWWRIYSVLRGILNPLLDRQAERDDRVRESILENERLRREERAAARDSAD